ncbi:MAG: NAD-dependent epimerase/dehydratase family protein [Phycisphaerales bacterium]
MSISRRSFVRMTAGAGLASMVAPSFARFCPAASPMRVLILGGTSFLGPACTDVLLAHGHHVTHFNRGRLETKRKEAGRASVVPDGVEVLYGNRDPDKTADEWKGPQDGERDPQSPKGLSQLVGKKWDAVIDTSGYAPRIVRASAELLKDVVKSYVFISTISVYAKNDTPEADETAAVGHMDDESIEEMGANFEHYGPLKALCEKAAESVMPGRVCNIRPGFIVGPRDVSNRFMYWPRRISEGGEMAIPGAPEDPMQMIDVRDLAEWIVHVIEKSVFGTFNATSPSGAMTLGSFVAACREGVGADTKFTWIDREFAQAEEFSLPLAIPPIGELAGFHRRSTERAMKAGLKIRPMAQTAEATLKWYNDLTPEVQARVGAHVIKKAAEEELLRRWHERT